MNASRFAFLPLRRLMLRLILPLSLVVNCTSCHAPGNRRSSSIDVGVPPLYKMTRSQCCADAVTFRRNDDVLVIAGTASPIEFWKLSSQQLIYSLPESTGEGMLMFSPSGNLIASGWKVWDASTGKLIARMSGHRRKVTVDSLGVDSVKGKSVKETTQKPAGLTAIDLLDNGWFATGSDDKTIEIWDSRRSKLEQVLLGHQASVGALSFLQGSDLLLSGDASGEIKIWKTSSGEAIHSFYKHKYPIKGIHAISGTNIFASIDQSGLLCQWDFKSGQLIAQMNLNLVVPEASFSRDGHRFVVSAADYSLDSSSPIGTINVYETRTGRLMHSLYSPVPDAVALSANGRFLSVAGIDYKRTFKNGYHSVVQVWSVQ